MTNIRRLHRHATQPPPEPPVGDPTLSSVYRPTPRWSDRHDLARDICCVLRDHGGSEWELRDDEPYRSLRALLYDQRLL